MKQEEIEDKVKEMIEELTGIPQSDIRNDSLIMMMMDSLDHIDFTMMLEEEFEIIIDDPIIIEAKTFAQVVQLIKSLL